MGVVRGLLSNAGKLSIAGSAAAIAWSRLLVDHDLPLPPSLPGEAIGIGDGSSGHVQLYADQSGQGDPVLLVHSVNAAASAFEMEPIYTRLQGKRPVWAIDLPGYGASDRSDRSYTPMLMADAIASALERIGEPTDVVASSLGSEFAARAALEHPELVRSLALLSPTGLGPVRSPSAPAGSALRVPLWSQAIYDLIVTRPSIRYFLSQSFAGRPDERAIVHAYRTSHQPGARHAPLAFLAGELFALDAVSQLYAALTVPTLVIYDTDPFTSFVRLPELVDENDAWTPVRIPGTKGLPHWDRPVETLGALESHWAGVG